MPDLNIPTDYLTEAPAGSVWLLEHTEHDGDLKNVLVNVFTSPARALDVLGKRVGKRWGLIADHPLIPAGMPDNAAEVVAWYFSPMAEAERGDDHSETFELTLTAIDGRKSFTLDGRALVLSELALVCACGNAWHHTGAGGGFFHCDADGRGPGGSVGTDYRRCRKCGSVIRRTGEIVGRTTTTEPAPDLDPEDVPAWCLTWELAKVDKAGELVTRTEYTRDLSPRDMARVLAVPVAEVMNANTFELLELGGRGLENGLCEVEPTARELSGSEGDWNGWGEEITRTVYTIRELDRAPKE